MLDVQALSAVFLMDFFFAIIFAAGFFAALLDGGPIVE
jgi:hypothetical protein